ncbi:MAG TPA: metallophosphoesterase family protein [Verrucomicrobiae bacterium]|nr:metallophosphoesterase family protein [Verrucomicrobiae bacterium]
MLIGIFSDAHGDIAAVNQAIQALQPAQKLYYLGDVHEFTPAVKDCIDILRNNNVIAVKGNCDRHAVIGDTDGYYRRWLKNLPVEHKENDLVFVHEPKNPEYAFQRENFHICFCGHIHRSFLITAAGKRKITSGEIVELPQGSKYLVGIGSISRPRDGEDRVAALFDTEKTRLKLIEL